MRRIISVLAIASGISCTYKSDMNNNPGLDESVGWGSGAGGVRTLGGSKNVQEIVIQVAPTRQLDLIFVLDNSASTDIYHQKLKAQFPRLIQALKDPTANPQLPDLRIAIITADVGTGASGLCTPQYGDQGKFQMPNAATCGVDPGATFLEYKNGRNLNFAANRDIAETFGCLAVGLAATGCGLEQPLQSLYLSMFVADPVTKKTQAQQFIRPAASLGIILLTDEDDCSMPIDSLIAEESSIVATESYSLRCATRGHRCGATKMSYPTTAPYENDFYACQAREDTCAPSENGRNPTSCSPLENVKGLANKLKAVKAVTIDGRTTVDIEKFLVAGIFGWPRKDQTSATYKIDRRPSWTDGQESEVFDYWPVCYDPNFPLPANLGDRGRVSSALGSGGYGGLRIKAFLDEFPKNSALAFSICEPDYREAMTQIGQALARKLSNVCIPLRLRDADPNQNGLQPNCEVFDIVPVSETAGRVAMRTGPNIPHCEVAQGRKPCWNLSSEPNQCPETQDAAGNIIPSQVLLVERMELVESDTRTVLRCQTLP